MTLILDADQMPLGGVLSGSTLFGQTVYPNNLPIRKLRVNTVYHIQRNIKLNSAIRKTV